jgi:Domain of unknown function (DUF4149)
MQGQYNSLMRPLRYLYALALVLWLGGMVIAGFVVAPTTFSVLEAWDASTGRVLAGQVFGAVLRRVHLIGYGAAIVMLLALTLQRVLGPRPRHYGIRVGLLALMLGLMLYSGMALTPRIDRIQAEVTGPMNRLPTDDARRLEFDQLHRLSTILVTATIAGGLVLLTWETRE